MSRTSRQIRSLIFVVSAIMAIVGAAAPVSAADIYVDTTSDLYNGNCILQCSLRDAILVSNSNGQDDTIHVPAGLYNLTIPNGSTPSGETGDLFIDSPDAVTILGEGPGITIIDHNHAASVGGVLTEGTSDFYNVTIYYNTADDNIEGIRNTRTATLRHCTLVQGSAPTDIAISCNGGAVPTMKLYDSSMGSDNQWTTDHLLGHDARFVGRPVGTYGDSGAYELVPGEIFSHSFENGYTTGWSDTVQ